MAVKEFTGWEYLLIDVANNAGFDKLTFEERIDWATQHLDTLEDYRDSEQWKEKPLYLKAVQAVRKAQAGIETGHLVGFDAVCSGMQIMSAMTGCLEGAKATGLVHENVRSDAYTECTQAMSAILGSTVKVDRKKVKNACMTSLYGSVKEPKKEFGDDTPELEAFYQAMQQMAPGACELLEDLIKSWKPYALQHSWVLPDGFQAICKVMVKKEPRIEVDELNHTRFTYVYYVNEGVKKGVKNAANVVHSVDAYILRNLIRRCNYDAEQVELLQDAVTTEVLSRKLGNSTRSLSTPPGVVEYYIEHFERSGMADPVILPYLDEPCLRYLSTAHLVQLNQIMSSMLMHKPFEVITVHDDFRVHPNNVNALRRHYREILAQLADSHILDDLLSQLYHRSGHFPKKIPNLSQYILESNYALC